MKRFWVSVVLVLLATVAFADMDSDRFYAALNLKLGFAAYGIIDIDTDSSSYNKGKDENGDGVILDMYTPDSWTNVFNIANANNGRYMMVVLSNDGAFGNSSSNEVKVYKLDYSNIKEQFIKDFENTRANILGGASGNKQNNSQSGSASGSQNNTTQPPPLPDPSAVLDFLSHGNSSSSSSQNNAPSNFTTKTDPYPPGTSAADVFTLTCEITVKIGKPQEGLIGLLGGKKFKPDGTYSVYVNDKLYANVLKENTTTTIKVNAAAIKSIQVVYTPVNGGDKTSSAAISPTFTGGKLSLLATGKIVNSKMVIDLMKTN